MSETIGKTDLVDLVAKQTGSTKAAAAEAITALFDVIQSSVAHGKKVTITGFGTFDPRKRAARVGRNPSTGAELKIKASTVPGFKAGATFKAAVAKK